jgi:hypothetical protein
MGTVYLARQVSLDRKVALKTLHPHWASDPTFLARFTREAYAAALVLDRRAAHEQTGPREDAERLLKSLRLRGADEGALRLFVCKYAGDHWEEFFEALFGYDRLIEGRALAMRENDGRRRPRHAPWRDPIMRWIEARLRVGKERREKELLTRVGRQDVEAQGVAAPEAQEQAEHAATILVQQVGSGCPARQVQGIIPTVDPKTP